MSCSSLSLLLFDRHDEGLFRVFYYSRFQCEYVLIDKGMALQ